MRKALRPLLAACFFVCPLLFFTNLTRNPYVTQICLLNMSLLLAGAMTLWAASNEGPAALPRTALDLPLAVWVGVCVLSWLVSFSLHKAFFRPSMEAEGAMKFLFLLANTLLPFYLAALLVREGGAGDDEEVSLGGWAFFALGWGALWAVYPQARGPSAAPADIFGHLWDGYGFCVWAVGFGGALWLCRRGRWADFLHLGLAAGFVASVYGVLQYFNIDFIWPQSLNPYGGRAVSTFGNPNFLSSFNVILLPVAATLFSRSRGGRRLAYGALFLALEAALLCTLTRSSWLGAIAALGALLLMPEFRREAAEDPRPHGLLAAVGAAMALLWPSSAIVSGYTPSVVGRVTEVVSAARAHEKYGSFYQRLLIWTCGWLMGQDNPLTGKGFGLYELFYPFYQGPVLLFFDFWRPMRTHANNGHNELVETWAQTGLLGVGVYAWLWATFAAYAAARWIRRGARKTAVLAACAAGCVGMLVDNMLNVSLHFAVPGFLFWWAAGSAMALPPAPERSEGVSFRAPERSEGASLRTKARKEAPAAPAPRAAWTWGARLAAVVLVALCWVWVRVWFREAHYFAGFKLARQKVVPAAERELERSRDWGPREVNAVYELGNVYAQGQQFQQAADAYRLALRANAGYDEIFYNLGAVEAAHLGKLDDALDNFEMARWINPTSHEVYASLGNLYLQAPQTYAAQARSLFEQGVRVYPDNAAYWANLGYLHALAKEWPEAERCYTRALTLDPALNAAQANLESVLRQSGRPRPPILSALADLKRLEERVGKRDYSEATLALARRLDSDLPDNTRARFFLGSLLLARGRPVDAAPVLEWVVSREPGNLWARVNLGECYLALRRPDQAAVQYRAALALDGSNPVAKQRLAQLGGR